MESFEEKAFLNVLRVLQSYLNKTVFPILAVFLYNYNIMIVIINNVIHYYQLRLITIRLHNLKGEFANLFYWPI